MGRSRRNAVRIELVGVSGVTAVVDRPQQIIHHLVIEEAGWLRRGFVVVFDHWSLRSCGTWYT